MTTYSNRLTLEVVLVPNRCPGFHQDSQNLLRCRQTCLPQPDQLYLEIPSSRHRSRPRRPLLFWDSSPQWSGCVSPSLLPCRRAVFPVDSCKKPPDAFSFLRIEITCRFISYYDFRPVEQSPCYGAPLLLAA